MRLEFFVAGDAKPKGTLVAGKRADGTTYYRPVDGEKHNTQVKWASTVRLAAQRAMETLGVVDANGWPKPFEDPIRLDLVFQRERPKKHFGTGKHAGVLRPEFAFAQPKTAPDWDKLARSVGDALQGVVYRDDAQVTDGRVRKRWGSPGVHVVIAFDVEVHTTPDASPPHRPPTSQLALPVEEDPFA